MASAYTHATALRIYAAIAASGENGVDIDQLQQATGLAGNTLRTYARWLEDDGAIEIAEVHSEALNRPLKNLYLAIRQPQPRLTDAERFRQIIEILEPFSREPKSYDIKWKTELRIAIEKAIRLAC